MVNLELKEATFIKLDPKIAKLEPNSAYLGFKEANVERNVVHIAP